MTAPPDLPKSLKATLPVPRGPVSPPTGRSLRARWRWYMIMGMNALVVVIVMTALLIASLEQRGAVIRLHETTIRQTHVAMQQSINSIQLAILAGTSSGGADLDRLVAQIDAQPALLAISIVDQDGTEIAHVPADSARIAPNWAEHPAWIALNKGDSDAVYRLAGDGTALLTLAIAATDQTGVVIAEIDAVQLWADVLAVTMGEKGLVYVLDDSGMMLAAHPDYAAGDPGRAADFAVFKKARGGGGHVRLYQGLDNRWVIGRGEGFPAAGYTLVAETPLSEFTPSVVRVAGLAVLALLITAITGEWLIRLILKTVLAPLERLRAGARAVTAGDFRYRVRVPENTDRELIELGQAFNKMIEKLAESQRQIDAYTHEMQETIDQCARELARKASQLEIAAEVSNKITSLLDQRELIKEVTRLIQAQFKVYHVELLRIDEDTGRITSCNERRREVLPDLTLRDAQYSVVAWVARHGQKLYLPDVNADKRYLRTPDLPASQTELAIPLRYANNVIGVLNLEDDHPNAFPDDEIAVLESLANTVAVALHNAQTFEALEVANRDLFQASMLAKEANTLKSRFLFNASHKLRTPLNSIIGYSETILSGVYDDTPGTVQDRQRRILENGRVLNALVEDMLDLSAIETGLLQLELDWIELSALLEEVMNATRALHMTAHADHDLDLRIDLDAVAALPPVWADLERLRYILINLTSNAVKFTESGEVVLSADFDDDWVRIRVRDTGPGISEDDVRYLFQPFQHQGGSTGLEGKGTGLGLPVSRLLAMHHGGELTVTSTLDEGSTFTLNLPRHPDGAPPPDRGS